MSMSKDPAFLFYPSDFLTGTMLMSNEQVGIYIRILCYEHQHGHLTKAQLLKMCGTYDEEIFSKFVLDDDGNYYNERLEKEKARRIKYSESRRQNRSKNPKDVKKICESYVPHMETETITIDKPSVLDKKEIGECERKEREKRPTLEEVQAYCTERGNTVDAQRFIDYYSAQGWKLANGNTLKDWKAAVRTWESREREKPTGNVFAKMLAEGAFDE